MRRTDVNSETGIDCHAAWPDGRRACGAKGQGFVSCESRRGQVFFKLRFRINGTQRVCYLGKDLAVVEQVQEWLAEVQAVRKTEIELGRLVREVGQKLRNCKEEILPLLAEAGYRFHGLSIRQRSPVE